MLNQSRLIKWRWFALSVVILLLDQFTKHLAVENLVFYTPVEITSFFNFTLMYNFGAAFSFLHDAGGWQRWFFVVTALIISLVISVWLYRIPSEQKWLTIALALILGGAIGNIYDRIVLGYVVDFLDFHLYGWHWPAFNIADSAISVGVVMVLIDAFRGNSQDRI